jgi:hypothetical protein
VVAVSRRTVLAAGAGGALLTACTAGGSPAAVPTTPPPPDPLLAELAQEQRLVAVYDATATRYPALRARLAGPRADHAEHAAALTRLLGRPAGLPSPAATATASAAPVLVAKTAAAALVGLRAAERAAASARGTAALTASADRARLLAGISASEASHLVVLE